MIPYYPLNTRERPSITEAGGKGVSLIRMTSLGFTVPEGIILPTDYFSPWLKELKSRDEWRWFITCSEEELPRACDTLKSITRNMPYNHQQQKALEEGMELFKEKKGFYAVRSSSPEEDLEQASFAGEYTSLLSIPIEGLETAIREVFCSCLDHRVVLYKREKGFPTDTPRLAVIIQEMIDADVSGVAFSLNPVNNCYDEVVVNANFGLGESVVSGMVTPDRFVVDKVEKNILQEYVGSKEKILKQRSDGGVYEESGKTGISLSHEQLLKLTNLVCEVEKYFAGPVDIEWAYKDAWLYLLQARPITAYYPLPEKMQTLPGERKRVYLDTILTKQGIRESLSVLGCTYFSMFSEKLLKSTSGPGLIGDIENSVAFFLEGRSYANLSNILKLRGVKKYASGLKIIDPYSAEIIENIDAAYISPKIPPGIKGISFSTIALVLRIIMRIVKVFDNPGAYKIFCLNERTLFLDRLKHISAETETLAEYITKTGELVLKFIFEITIPVTYATMMAAPRIKRLFADSPEEIRGLIENIDRSMPENVTIEMGLDLYTLSCFNEVHLPEEEFLNRLRTGSLSSDFTAAWGNFMEKYGFRGVREIDIASPRYKEQPEIIFRQLKTMAGGSNSAANAKTVFEKSVADRKAAYETLKEIIKQKGKRKSDRFEKYYSILVEFGGWRELHKYYFVMVNNLVRERALEMGTKMFQTGYLDKPEQIFDLTLDQLNQDPQNFRGFIKENTAFKKRVAHVKEFPRVIDSRGKILRPPAKKTDGLAGEPVSPGKVEGFVKVLKDPYEKPIEPGDILVTRATDPGWTPLFINAAGIILEVGGSLQHGACVAREYGKPCITGMEGITKLLKDGQIIEMDGGSGVIKILG